MNNLKVNIWYSSHTSEWRWSLCDESTTPMRQESGGQPHLRDAMNDIANTIEYLTTLDLPE